VILSEQAQRNPSVSSIKQNWSIHERYVSRQFPEIFTDVVAPATDTFDVAAAADAEFTFAPSDTFGARIAAAVVLARDGRSAAKTGSVKHAANKKAQNLFISILPNILYILSYTAHTHNRKIINL
jgi:hypothetical protein